MRDDFDSLIEASANDGYDLFAEAAMKADVRSLLAGMIPYGDNDLVEVAQRVLKVGAKGILEGNPSPAFLFFLATSIIKTIDDDDPSLDVAFGLRRKRGNQKKPPQDDDHIVIAFINAMSCAFPWLKTPSRGDVGFDELERRALDAAYTAMHGKTQREHMKMRFNSKSILDRMTAVKRLLHERGLYMLDKRKGKRKDQAM